MVSFVLDEYIVNEDAGAVSVCVDSGVTEGFQADLTVSLSAADGTACEKNPVILPLFQCLFQS